MNNHYSIKNMGWNQDIEAGQSVTIGFQANCQEDVMPPVKYTTNRSEQEVDHSCYEASLKITNYWGSGYSGELVIKNLTEQPLEDWCIAFDFTGEINHFWIADILEHIENHYTVKNKGYNENIPARQSITLGFSGSDAEDASIIGQSFKLYSVNEVQKIETVDEEKDSGQDDLLDCYESELGSDLLNPDSDGDRLSDGYEVFIVETNPMKQDVVLILQILIKMDYMMFLNLKD